MIHCGPIPQLLQKLSRLHSRNVIAFTIFIAAMMMSSVLATPVFQQQKFLRLSFDGGCRGVNGMAGGGAILHLCNAPNTADSRCDTASDKISSNIIHDIPGRSAEATKQLRTTSSTLRRGSSKQHEHDKEHSAAENTSDSYDKEHSAVENTSDSDFYEEIEIWKGSFFFGDGLSSHLAEYLSLIEGLYALKMILSENILPFYSSSASKQKTVTQSVYNKGIINTSRSVSQSQYSSSKEQTTHNKNTDKTIILSDTVESEFFLQNRILIRGDSEIIIKNLNYDYVPRDLALQSTHILAAALLHSLCISNNDADADAYSNIHADSFLHPNKNSYINSDSDMNVVTDTDTDFFSGVVLKSNRESHNEIVSSSSPQTPPPSPSNNNKYENNYHLYHVHRHDNIRADKLSTEAVLSQLSHSHYCSGVNCLLRRKREKINERMDRKEGEEREEGNEREDRMKKGEREERKEGKESEESKRCKMRKESEDVREGLRVEMEGSDSGGVHCDQLEDFNVRQLNVRDNNINVTKYFDYDNNSNDNNNNIKNKSKKNDDNGHNDSDGDDNEEDVNDKNNDNKIGGLLFLKLSSNNIPQHLISTFEQMDVTLSINNMTIITPLKFESEKKERKFVLGDKKFQKKIRSLPVTSKNNINTKKYKTQKQDIVYDENKNRDCIICIDNLCLYSEYNKNPKIKIKLSKRKMEINETEKFDEFPTQKYNELSEILLSYDTENNCLLLSDRISCSELKGEKIENNEGITKSSREEVQYLQDRQWHMTIPIKLPQEHTSEHSTERSLEYTEDQSKVPSSSPIDFEREKEHEEFFDVQISFFPIPVLPFFTPTKPLSSDESSLYLYSNTVESNATSSSIFSSSFAFSTPPLLSPSLLSSCSSSSTLISSPSPSITSPLNIIGISILQPFLVRDKTRNDEEDSIMVIRS